MKAGVGETLPGGGTVWRYAAAQSAVTALLIYGLFAPLIFYFLIDYATQLVAPGEGEARQWILLFPVGLLSVFAVVLVGGIPATLIMLFDKRPYLMLDADGLKVRELHDPRRFLHVHAMRWSEIEEIGLSRQLTHIEVRVHRSGARETVKIHPNVIGAESGALVETLRAEWMNHGGRAREPAPQTRATASGAARREWRLSSEYGKWMLVAAVIAVVFLVYFIWTPLAALPGNLRPPITPWVFLFNTFWLVFPLFILGRFLQLAIECIASFVDKQPRLVLDLEGLHERSFAFRAMGLSTRSARWSEIDDVKLTYRGPLMQPRRYPNKIKVRVVRDGRSSVWTIDTFGLLGENRESLFEAIDKAWRERTLRPSRITAPA